MNPAIPRHCLSDADHLAIDRLARRYADVIDRRAWGELAELFTPEAVVTIDLVTHDAGGLTDLDIQLATRVDRALGA